MSLKHLPGRGLPRTYIVCTENRDTGEIFNRFGTDPTWQLRELATEHTAIVTAPRELAHLLLEIVDTKVREK